MDQITVYEKPTCTTCRNLFALLKDEGIDFEKVDYHVLGLKAEEVRDILAKTGLSAREVLRKREPVYKELELDKRDLSEDELVDLMVEHPALMQRPIVLKGDRGVLARPVEKVREIL
ncbi:arsenate reductase [Nocardioides luteus]|uniref:Arsenate reductase n=1 Tax=Nocardioides luteus TaxID=1844 RepID=A0ABQ5SZR1_9ACTN|nr:arsenate reductase (glutaredoxin) [Nocardioides luteus]MDR7310746.1 arsenate reductase [Nocardioides luteus]GGR40874.1 arsenate reductase [Nocardioides luteus]GLJ69474.1 arsenate reductase [Nocardioides luteus]